MSEHDDRMPGRTQGSGPDDTSHGSDLPESLGLWLEGGPSYLSASTRQAIFAGIRVTGQARKETTMVGLTRQRPKGAGWIALVAAALVGLAAIGAVIATAGRSTTPVQPAVLPAATVTPAPSVAPTKAISFRTPFSYRLPAGFDPTPIQGEVGIYRWDTIEQTPAGDAPTGTLVVRAIGERYVDPCDVNKGIGLLKGGPAGTVAYLQSIAGLKTGSATATTVDGQPASQVVIQLAPTAACPVVWTWPERLASLNEGLGQDQAIRFTITQVGEQLVAIGAITLATDVDTFAPTADAFIASLRFDANHPGTSKPTPTPNVLQP